MVANPKPLEEQELHLPAAVHEEARLVSAFTLRSCTARE
jgi:hypothetical protein